MKKLGRLVVVAVIAVGVASMAAGAAFIGLGADKHAYLKAAMDEEQITLGINDSQLAAGEVVDTMKETQVAGDIVRSHRHEIAPTYGELLGGERFDPTDLEQLTYAQAMNIENYLYLAANSFGVTYLTIGVGLVLLLVGLALIGLAALLHAWAKRVAAEVAVSAQGVA